MVEDSVKSVLSFQYAGLRDQTRVLRLGQCLYHLSHGEGRVQLLSPLKAGGPNSSVCVVSKASSVSKISYKPWNVSVLLIIFSWITC